MAQPFALCAKAGVDSNSLDDTETVRKNGYACRGFRKVGSTSEPTPRTNDSVICGIPLLAQRRREKWGTPVEAYDLGQNHTKQELAAGDVGHPAW